VPHKQTFNMASRVKTNSGRGESPMGATFEGKMTDVVGGTAGMGRQADSSSSIAVAAR
jgi:hypothetical protein